MLEMFWRDIRYGMRLLAKNPGFAGIIIVTLGLCIGANSAIFSVIDSVLIRPLFFKDSQQLVYIWTIDSDGDESASSYRDVMDWKQREDLFQDVSAMSVFGHNLTGGIDPEYTQVATVFPN